MTRSIFRIVLSTFALVLLFAGSMNMNRTNATELAEGGDVETIVAPSKCQELAGCPGGPTTCGTLILDDGTIVKCGMR